MRIAPVAALALLSLAACGKSGADDVKLENASIAEVAAATQSSTDVFRPGKWKTSNQLVSADMPGVPKQTADQLAKAMSQTSAVEHCMTPEEAKKPTEAFAKDNGECRFDKFTMSGGKLDSVMHCQQPGQPGSMVMTMTGTYTPEHYETDAEVKISHAGKDMTMKIRSVSDRIGDCKA